MGLFDTINEATYSEGGVYILEGIYRLEVLSVISKRARAGYDCFIVEVRVIESSNKERLPNSICSWMVKLPPPSDKESPAMGNVKQFLATAIGCDMSQINPQIAEAAVSTDNPLKGKILRANATNIMTKRNTPFTKVKWFSDNVGAAEIAQAA